jgi:hypothetical protein
VERFCPGNKSCMMALNTGKSFGTNFGILLSIIDFIRTVKSERFRFYYLRFAAFERTDFIDLIPKS